MDLGHLPVANVIDEGDFLAEEFEVAEIAIDEYPQRVAGALGRVGSLAPRGGEPAEQETSCDRKPRPGRTGEATSHVEFAISEKVVDLIASSSSSTLSVHDPDALHVGP
jgi:hypothetical protein